MFFEIPTCVNCEWCALLRILVGWMKTLDLDIFDSFDLKNKKIWKFLKCLVIVTKAMYKTIQVKIGIHISF